ncbi:MAG: hypothetical protein V9H69_14580 [Anaerolineae bacterium]
MAVLPNNNAQRPKRVLLVTDAFLNLASGARVAHQIARILLDAGISVTVLDHGVSGNMPEDLRSAHDLEIVRWRKRTFPAMFHIIPDDDTRHFAKILDDLKPDVVHLCSFNYGKPRFLVSETKKRGIRVVTQYFRYDLYCGRDGYDALEGRPCGKCNGGRTWSAFRYGCGRTATRPVEVISRYLIWKQTNPLVDAALSTCTHMDDVLIQAGLSPDRIVRCPLPYDASQLEGLQAVDGDHFFFSGAFSEAKGAHLLEPVIEAVGDARFVLLLLTSASDQQRYDEFRNQMISRYGHRLVVNDKMRWDTGGSEFARTCRGALQPTVWPSSTEYTLLEMLGLAKPIVAFNVGVHKDYLVHQKNAMVYEIGDLEGFIEGIIQINRDSELRQSLSIGARELFERMVDNDVVRNALLKAYDF